MNGHRRRDHPVRDGTQTAYGRTPIRGPAATRTPSSITIRHRRRWPRAAHGGLAAEWAEVAPTVQARLIHDTARAPGRAGSGPRRHRRPAGPCRVSPRCGPAQPRSRATNRSSDSRPVATARVSSDRDARLDPDGARHAPTRCRRPASRPRCAARDQRRPCPPDRLPAPPGAPRHDPRTRSRTGGFIFMRGPTASHLLGAQEQVVGAHLAGHVARPGHASARSPRARRATTGGRYALAHPVSSARTPIRSMATTSASTGRLSGWTRASVRPVARTRVVAAATMVWSSAWTARRIPRDLMMRHRPLQRRIRRCRQTAGRGAHEGLVPDHETRLCHRRELIDRSVDHQAEQADITPGSARPGELVGRPSDRIRGWVRVGHIQHGRDAAHDRGQRPAAEVLLVRVARLAEVDVRVDDAAHDMQIHGRPGAPARQRQPTIQAGRTSRSAHPGRRCPAPPARRA